MALTERSRAALYRGLAAIIEDEEAVAEMLSQFPARDVEELATRGDLTVLRSEMDAFRSEMRAEFAAFREQVRVEMHTEFRRMMVWNVSTMLAIATILVAVMAATR